MRAARWDNILVLLTFSFLLLIASSITIVSADEEYVAIRGENVAISVILLQNGTYGNPVPNQAIEFYDQTNDLLLGINYTDANGLTMFNWVIPNDYPLGPTIVNATFRGNESLFLLPSDQSILLNILASTTITLYNTPTLLAPGDMLSFSINLQDDTTSPLANRSVVLYGNDNFLASGVTNGTGGIFFSIHCNSSWILLGDNIIRIIHEQDIANNYARAETIFSVEIKQIRTTLLSNFSHNSISLGDSIDFEVNLTSIEGGISANLTIQLDDVPISYTTTNLLGVSSIHIDIDERFTLDHHSITVVFNGTDRYSESFLINEFDVISDAEFNIIIPSFPVIGTETEIIISIHDNLNRSIEGLLTITDINNGQNISIQIPKDIVDINIVFSFLGPVGLHNLLMEINNPFVTNPSMIHNITIWTRPIISLRNSNVQHYASPKQEVIFTLHLADWSGNITLQSIQLLCNGELLELARSDAEGIASFSFLAPSDEGMYNLSFMYPLNITRYELPAKLDYYLVVTSIMPVLVELDYYEVLPPLQQISISLNIQCLNGSIVARIPLTITWQSIERSVVTNQYGQLLIHLPIPETSGNYTLSYTINQAYNLAFSSGTITIHVSLMDIMTSQGIGINGFVLGFLASLTIFAIPLIRQKYLIM